MSLSAYESLHVYFGDLHSHCNIGYGHGSLEDAYQNAQLQLDFASVTAHAVWPDIPEDEPRLADVVQYHRRGFQQARDKWSYFADVTRNNNHEGQFVTFPSFEWHSIRYGDHNVYFHTDNTQIVWAMDLADMREHLAELASQGVETFLIPHHIGYRQGYRGIDWNSFDSRFSPVVEILSMHGLAEAGMGPYPYLHTMGSVDYHSSMQYGLESGHIFGFIGSTDHHSAHPGSYGNGRIGVWAEALTRDALWSAIAGRRTYALTGDQIALAFSINAQPMGSVLPWTSRRWIDVSVDAGSAIDYVDLIHNNQLLERWTVSGSKSATPVTGIYKVLFEVGWGLKDNNIDWQVELDVVGGRLASIEPRFRGPDILEPQVDIPNQFAFSGWQPTENGVTFHTRTWGNPATTTSATQGICLEIEADEHTLLTGRINQEVIRVPISDLIQGSRSGYLGGFLTPSYCFHRAVPQEEYQRRFTFEHISHNSNREWYYVKVRQHNGQWAWTSPIWIG